MTTQNTRLGISLMVMTMFIFAMQDGLSRHLAESYNVMMVVMLRYWFFAIFVVALVSRTPGGLRRAWETPQRGLQILRGVLLAVEICIAIYAFTLIGLVQSLTVFGCYPLLVAALSGPVLGERVGWRRWTAIGLGFVGLMIILQPGMGVFDPRAIVPFISALLFALYALMTRYAARKDSAMTSFFWTGTAGAVVLTALGIWSWEPMTPADQLLMALLCVTGAAGHYTLIKCYEIAEASDVQPFAYLHLVFGSLLGIVVFGDALTANIILGGAIIVAAGLFTLWREKVTT